MTIPGQWVASQNDEVFQSGGPYETKEQAVESFPVEWGLKAGDGFYVGQFEEVSAPCIDGASIIEQAGAELYDMVGEVSEEWPDTLPEQEKELGEKLTAVFHQWIEDHGLAPTFYSVVGVEQFTARSPKETK